MEKPYNLKDFTRDFTLRRSLLINSGTIVGNEDGEDGR
jgi:hypothetical protein